MENPSWNRLSIPERRSSILHRKSAFNKRESNPLPQKPKTSREPEASKNSENSLKSLNPYETEGFFEFVSYLYCHPPVLLRDGSMIHLTKVIEKLKVLVECRPSGLQGRIVAVVDAFSVDDMGITGTDRLSP